MPPRSYSKNQPYGYAGLDKDGKLVQQCIPAGIGGSGGGNVDGGTPDSMYGGAIEIDGGGP